MGDDSASGGLDVVATVSHETLAPSETPAAKVAAARSTRAEKIAAARTARLSGNADAAPHVPDTDAGAADTQASPAAPASESTTEKHDESTQRGLDAIEKRDKRAREQLTKERAEAKAELDRERAELAKLRAEANKPAPFDDLKKLPAKDRYLQALKLAGLDPDDDESMEVIARDAYARSKSGKADPKNKAYAEQIGERDSVKSELADLRRQLEETRSSLTEREQRQQAESFQQKYLDEAVKAIPAAASLAGRALAKNPDRARGELLRVGQALETELGETPSHAEVVARYESLLRQDLLDRGLDETTIAAMLSPPKAATAAPAAPKPMRTLDPGAGSITPTINGTATRAQRLAVAKQGLKKLLAEG